MTRTVENKAIIIFVLSKGVKAAIIKRSDVQLLLSTWLSKSYV